MDSTKSNLLVLQEPPWSLLTTCHRQARVVHSLSRQMDFKGSLAISKYANCSPSTWNLSLIRTTVLINKLNYCEISELITSKELNYTSDSTTVLTQEKKRGSFLINYVWILIYLFWDVDAPLFQRYWLSPASGISTDYNSRENSLQEHICWTRKQMEFAVVQQGTVAVSLLLVAWLRKIKSCFQDAFTKRWRRRRQSKDKKSHHKNVASSYTDSSMLP